MKRILFLAMSFAMALTVKAQDDVTSLLSNPDFENGTSGWTIVGGNKIAATAVNYGYSGTMFMEEWVGAPNTLGDRNWYQTIEVPNGVYVIKSLAHAILQSDASVVPAGVAIYANKDEVAVTTTNTNPPTEYSVATVVTDGKLTIGYRITSCNINWAAWDNVRVSQYTGATEEEAKLAWMRDELETLGTTAMELIENPMSQELAAAITATVNAIADVATYEAAAALLETLKAQVADAKLCIAAYEDYLAVVAAAEKELDRGFTEGVDEFNAAIAAAKAAHENGTLSLEEVEAAIVKLNDDIFTFQMLNADGTERFDVTGRFMTNPTLRKGNQGWSGSAPGLEHEVMEFYNCDFDMYQELTGLPNGMYVVQVQALYRVGGNDGGVAYEEGTENISAELYANNKSVPLISIYQHRASDMGVTSGEVLNDYVNMRVAINEAFNLTNPETGLGYYAENAVTIVVQDGTLKIGLRNSGHQSNSWCAFREFKLYYYGNFPAVVLTVSMENAEAWLDENDDVLPGTAYDELADAIAIAEEYTEIGAYEEAEVMAAMNELEAVLSSVQNVLALMNQLKKMTVKVEDELIALEYPGLDALFEAYDMAYYLSEEGAYVDLAEGQTTEEYYIEAVASFEAAIDAYYESQEVSKDVAANYTHLLPNPNFEQKGNWTWSVVGIGTDQWNGGCRPNVDGITRQGVNLWGWGITSIDVHQELTNLPNGLYKVSAELITQAGYATDQHVYAVGVAKTTSKALEIEGWDTYEWETLMTNDYAVVLDGKLTIGAASSQGGTNSEGWFQATNFKLHYYGEATDEDLKAVWEASLARANEYTAILLPGDSKEVAAAIAAASAMAAEGKYTDACQALNPVVAASDSVYNVTLKFREGNYQTLLDLIEGIEEGAASLQVIEAAIGFADAALAAEDATHKILEPTNAKLGGYVAYVTYLIEVENTIPALKGLKAEHRNYMNEAVIAAQVADLVAKFRTAADCEYFLAKLKKAMEGLKGSLNGNLTAGDLTLDLIENPAIDDAAATGWTVVTGNALNAGTNRGEHYDSRTPDNIYLDAWNPNVGVNNVTFYQEIFGLPDGTYQLTVATRADGDNVYVFAAPEPLEEDTAAWTAATQWDMVNNYGAFGGEIFAADTLKMLADQAAGVVNDYPYYLARDGQGYGWSYDTINVVVTRRYLAIGITANQLLTGQAQYNGTWLGADDWKLVLVEKAAVQSEFDPFAGIEDVETYAMTAQDVVAEPSSIVNIPIELKNSTAVTAFQFDLYLPEGIATVYDVLLNGYRATDSHRVAYSEQPDGALRVLVYSTEDMPLVGNSGVVVDVAVGISSAASEWDYPIVLRNVRMVTSEVEEILGADYTATLTVTRGPLMGDVNSDGVYTMRDVVMMVNAVLNIAQNNFNAAVADINGDGQLTIVDVVSVVRFVLGYEPVAAARDMHRESSSVAIEAGSLMAGNHGEILLPIYMASDADYTAFQMDVVLPEGLTLADATLGGRGKSSHTLSWSTLGNGATRIVAFAMDNAAFKDNAEALAILTLKAEGALQEGAVINLTDGLFATASGAEDRAADVALKVEDETTGVGTLLGGIRVSGAEGAVVVESAADAVLSIYTMTGQLVQQAEVKAGESRIALPAGVYVVNNQKVVVK